MPSQANRNQRLICGGRLSKGPTYPGIDPHGWRLIGWRVVPIGSVAFPGAGLLVVERTALAARRRWHIVRRRAHPDHVIPLGGVGLAGRRGGRVGPVAAPGVVVRRGIGEGRAGVRGLVGALRRTVAGVGVRVGGRRWVRGGRGVADVTPVDILWRRLLVGVTWGRERQPHGQHATMEDKRLYSIHSNN